ncbi:MAG: class I SAM-dependent methyltransferase [Gammaproteobacteria bacterium]
MTEDHIAADSCPVCGGSARPDFSGRDLLFDRPGEYQYARCRECAAVFQTPMPDNERIASFYPDEYEQYQPERTKPVKSFEKGALRAVHGYSHLQVPPLYILAGQLLGRSKYRDAPPFRPGHRALDIGCGNGKFLNKLRSLGWDAQGVEFNAAAAGVCHANGLTVFHGDLHSAGFPDAGFDMVSARHVIEHIPEPDRFMAEVARILRPGGYFYVRTPNSKALGRKLFGRYWFPNDVPRHLVLFSPENLSALAGRHGLKKTSLLTFSSPKAVLNSIDYARDGRNGVSKRSSWRRLLARIFYVWPSRISARGDEIFAIYEKHDYLP